MGLVRGFVFSIDRRGILAVLAIAVSVGYALVAGATVTGLEDAQGALAGDLQDPGLVVTMPDGDGFDPDEMPVDPDHAIATQTVGDRTFSTVRAGDSDGNAPNATTAIAGPSTSLPAPDANGTIRIEAGGRSLVVERGERAPAAVPFYVGGTEELVSSIGVTVASSALVVGLLASGFVSMELKAKRQSLATLKLYAGTGLLRRVVASRGFVLLLGGQALALGLTVGLTELLTAATRLDVTLEPVLAGTALGATLLGGALGMLGPLWRAGERVDAASLNQEQPPEWLPRPLRLSLASWRLLVPLIAAGVILAASLGVVFGIVDIPTQLFGAEGEVIASTSGNPLRGSVDPFPGYHMGQVDGFRGASPEIFVPTQLGGQAVMARGIAWDNVQHLEQLTVTSGNPPSGEGDAMVGNRLANRLDVSAGDRLTLPSAYSASVTRVEVTGVFAGGGLLEDELLLGLDTARGMTRLDADRVNMVRYERTNTTVDPSVPDGVEVTSLDLEPEDPVPFEPVTVRVGLVNFGDVAKTDRVSVRVNGDTVADAWPTVPARSTAKAELSFNAPKQGVNRVDVNPTTRPESSDPAFRIEAPEVVTTDGPFTVSIGDEEGNRAAGVTVRAHGVENTTNAEGQAGLELTEPGNRTLVASGPDGRAARPLLVVDPGDLNRAKVVPQSIAGPQQLTAGERFRGVIDLVNLGGEAFDGRPKLSVGNETRNLTRVVLLSGQSARIPVELDLDEGVHELGPPGRNLTVTVTSPGDVSSAGNGTNGSETGPSIEELLERRREQAQTASGTGQSATQAFLGDTFGNLNAALTVIVTATVLHAGLVTVVAVFRQVEERNANLGTLTAMGASRGATRNRGLREYAIVGLPAALAGTTLGLAVAWLGAQQGLLTGFGHALVPRTSIGFVLRVVAAALATTLLAAAFAIEANLGDDTSSMLAEGPARSQRPPLGVLIDDPDEAMDGTSNAEGSESS